MISALKTAWKFYSIVILIFTSAVFILPDNIFLNKTPLCESKSDSGRECFMCGMTHAFSCISKGNFDDANGHNTASIPLFILFSVNSVIFSVISFKKFNNMKGNKI